MTAQEQVLPAVAAAEPRQPDPLDDTQLLAQVIHDLKNPLSVLLCYADLIPEATEGERREYCQRLQANARALLELLDAFALLSDLRAGRAERTRVPCDWTTLVLGVVGELAPVASFRDQRLACETSGPRAIAGDRFQLTLAVRELLLEALRVAAPGATLNVAAAGDAQGVTVQVAVGSDSRSHSDHALFDVRRPALELVRRVVALHGGSLSFDLQASCVVATIYLPA